MAEQAKDRGEIENELSSAAVQIAQCGYAPQAKGPQKLSGRKLACGCNGVDFKNSIRVAREKPEEWEIGWAD